jgi:hypothetical protein
LRIDGKASDLSEAAIHLEVDAVDTD